MSKPKSITVFDERYYEIKKKFYPSVTWILNAYPKGAYFEQWLTQNGEEATKIKEEAMDRGSKVHNAIQDMLNGAELQYKVPYYSQIAQENVPLNDNEWQHLITFCKWWNEVKPKLIATERIVYSTKRKYAGTIDAILKIDGKLFIADWKTSGAIYPTYWMQVSAYAMALEQMVKGLKIDGAVIVRTNTRHKAGYEAPTIDAKAIKQQYNNFLVVKDVWSIENGKKSPVEREIPSSLKLEVEMSEL